MQRTSKRPAATYEVGDVYVVALPELKEVEVEDVVPTAEIIKIRGEGWLDCATLDKAVRAKLGKAVYSGGLLGRKRTVVRQCT